MKKSLFTLCLITLSLNAQIQVTTITPEIKGSGGLSLDAVGNLIIADFGDFLSFSDPDGLPNDVSIMDSDFNISQYSTGFIGASGNSFDNNGVLYQSDIRANAIYKIIGGVRTFVTSTGISAPVGITFDSQDNFYVCNCGNNTIRKVTPSGVSTLFASGSAFFACPNGMTIDENDNLYVVNFSNPNIIKITPSGSVSIIGNTIAGNGHIDYNPITKNVYIASFSGNRIYALDTEDITATAQIIAGTGVSGNEDGEGLNATFRTPNGIAVTKTGDSIYVNTSIDPVTGNLNPQIIRLLTGVNSILSVSDSIGVVTSLNAYPNPVKNEFTIEAKLTLDYSNLTIRIYNIQGKILKEISNIKTLEQHLKTVINISNLPIGNYFYSLNEGNKQLFNGKIIKE